MLSNNCILPAQQSTQTIRKGYYYQSSLRGVFIKVVVNSRCFSKDGVCTIKIIADQTFTLTQSFSFDLSRDNLSQGFGFHIPGRPYACLHQVHDLDTGSWLRCNYENSADWWLSDRTRFNELPTQDLRVNHEGQFFAVQSVCASPESD